MTICFLGLTKRDSACCFICSKGIPFGDERKILARVDNRLFSLLANGVIYFGISYMPGFFQIVGKRLIGLRNNSYKRIKIIMAQPDGSFIDSFSDEQKQAILNYPSQLIKLAQSRYQPLRNPCRRAICTLLMDHDIVFHTSPPRRMWVLPVSDMLWKRG